MSTTGDADAEQSVEHLAELHREHERSTTQLQRVADQVTSTIARPGAVATVVALIFVWICGNYIARRIGVTALDQFPFPDLAFLATVGAMLIALLILTTQRHQDQLAERRSQLTLQVAILSEKKVAKIIELLEEQRRESPMLASRVDEEAAAMAQPVDPKQALKDIEEAT